MQTVLIKIMIQNLKEKKMMNKNKVRNKTKTFNTKLEKYKHFSRLCLDFQEKLALMFEYSVNHKILETMLFYFVIVLSALFLLTEVFKTKM